MHTPHKGAPLERGLNGAVILFAFYGIVPLIDMGSGLLDPWNAVLTGGIYTVPAIIEVLGLVRRSPWARRAGLVVSGVWFALSVANSAIALWWFSGDRPPGSELDLWSLVLQPALSLAVPALAILLLLSSRGVREVLDARSPKGP